MAHKIIMPQFGTSVDRVSILSWKLSEGDTVKKGDLLCEVETDKSALEIESFYSGTLLKIAAEEGAEAGIGETIAYIGEPGEQVPEEAAAAQQLVQPRHRRLQKRQFLPPGKPRPETAAR